MSESDEYYRLYKSKRIKDAGERELGVADQKSDSAMAGESLDEVDEMYSAFRRERMPDFDRSIANVMQVAKEKVMAEQVVDSLSTEQVNSTVENAPSSEFESEKGLSKGWVEGLLSAARTSANNVLQYAGDMFKPTWAGVAIPVIAVAVVVTGLMKFGFRDSDVRGYEIAMINSDTEVFSTPAETYDKDQVKALIVSYIEYSNVDSLGFSEQVSSQSSAFSLGVESVNLQMASLAGVDATIQESVEKITSLLPEAGSQELINKLNALTGASTTSDTQLSAVIQDIAAAEESSAAWFEWGRDIQQVYLSSQLALDKGILEPLIEMSKIIKPDFERLNGDYLTEPERNAASKLILATVAAGDDSTALSVDDLRNIRDSARDIKIMRTSQGL